MEINQITGIIIECACKVHSALGPGLLERPYQECLKHELVKRKLKALTEVTLPVLYDGTTLDIGYRLDLLVEDTVIVEIKVVDQVAPIHKMQLLTYLKLSKKPVGLLLNFNVTSMRNGILRIAN
jgi:GxxExxY protein